MRCNVAVVEVIHFPFRAQLSARHADPLRSRLVRCRNLRRKPIHAIPYLVTIRKATEVERQIAEAVGHLYSDKGSECDE
jgi:hypothetical protein